MATVSLLRATASFNSPSTNTRLILPSSSLCSLRLSSSSSTPLLSLRRKHPLTPFATSTSGWAQQEDEKLFAWTNGDEQEQIVDVQGEEDGDWFVEESYPDPSEETKIFVGNLPFDVDSEGLAKIFDQTGVVEIAEVIYSRETDESRGFGFVTMKTVEEAEKAVEMFNGRNYMGRVLNVNKAVPRGSRLDRPPRESTPLSRIFVGNLPWSVDNAQLAQVFREHGTVISARVVCDHGSGRSRGFGFVRMSTQAELDDAIAALDGQSLDGRALTVRIAEEVPRH